MHPSAYKQSVEAKSTIRIMVIKNGLLVRHNDEVVSFDDWKEAAPHVEEVIAAIKNKARS